MKVQKDKMIRLPSAAFGVDYDGRDHLYANCMDGVYKIHRGSGACKKLGSHTSYGSAARLLADGKTLITSGYDGVIKWFDVEKEEEIRSIPAHDFWSWNMTLSPDQTRIATVSGQYLAGGYKYEPRKADSPTVKILDVANGKTVFEFEHLPPVQSVAISPDNRFVAAGNLMGQVRIWDLANGKLVSEFESKDFTSWGIIKSHCYIGGIYAMTFDRSGEHVLIAGMGPMRDPMAGNGRQRWQAYRWNDENPQVKIASDDKECGEGLMEAIEVHPESNHVVMAGRLRGGDWNLGIFELPTGRLTQKVKTGDRVTDVRIHQKTSTLAVCGTIGQPNPKNKKQEFGRIHLFKIV